MNDIRSLVIPGAGRCLPMHSCQHVRADRAYKDAERVGKRLHWSDKLHCYSTHLKQNLYFKGRDSLISEPVNFQSPSGVNSRLCRMKNSHTQLLKPLFDIEYKVTCFNICHESETCNL